MEISKLGVNLSNNDFDRAHRVGRPSEEQGGSKERQMIVKFTSFRARTLVYKSRPKGANNRDKVRFYIDQTKRRFQLRKFAVDYVRDKPHIDFVFVDINCNLSIRFKNGEFKFFNSEDELRTLVG